MMLGIALFGVELPLWAVFLIVIIIAIIAWQIVKFALKILLFLVVFFIILAVLDYFNVFSLIQNLFSSLVY